MNTNPFKNILISISITLLLTSCDTDSLISSAKSLFQQKETKDQKTEDSPTKSPPTTAKKENPPTAQTKQPINQKNLPEHIQNTLKIKIAPKDPSSLVAKFKTKASKILHIDLWSKKYAIDGIGISGTNKMAIINKKALAQGDEISHGVTLKTISLTYVIIEYEGIEHILRPQDIQLLIDQERLQSPQTDLTKKPANKH